MDIAPSTERLIRSLVNEKQEACVMGIDIGLKGGTVSKFDNNLILTTMGGPQALAGHIQQVRPETVYAENVHTMPNQGAVSGGKLLEQKGELTGICAAFEIPLILIEPLRWIECFTLKRKKHFNTVDLWKHHLFLIAKELAGPNNTITLKNSDAFLIWAYGMSREIQQPLRPIGIFL